MRYLIEPSDEIYVTNHGFSSFVKNTKNTGKNTR